MNQDTSSMAVKFRLIGQKEVQKVEFVGRNRGQDADAFIFQNQIAGIKITDPITKQVIFEREPKADFHVVYPINR